MLTAQDVVYDLKIEERRPVLRLVAIATRKRVSHDDAAGIEIPEIFVPKSAPGMSHAVWEAHCLPMKAMGAMTDTGIYALEDIDRIETLNTVKEEEAKAKAFNELMGKFLAKVGEILKNSRTMLLPTPPGRAVAFAAHQEMERRGRLAADKLEAAEREALAEQ